MAGGLLLFLGNLILLSKMPYSFNQGDLLVFLATLLWATENTISKYVLKDLEGRIVAWARMFFGALFILIFLLGTNQFSIIFNLTLKQIYWVLITAVILFGYVMTWYSGLKLIPVSQATVILLLGSPITTLLSLVVVGKINLQEIFSGILIIFGVIFVIGFKEIWQIMKEVKKLTYAGN